jgi:hypothetical protein
MLTDAYQKTADNVRYPGIISIATRLGTLGLGTVSYHAVSTLSENGLLSRAVVYGNKSEQAVPALSAQKSICHMNNPPLYFFYAPGYINYL